jgi:hypothetical protein
MSSTRLALASAAVAIVALGCQQVRSSQASSAPKPHPAAFASVGEAAATAPAAAVAPAVDAVVAAEVSPLPGPSASVSGLSPVALQWKQRSLTGGRAEVTLVIEKRAATGADLSFTIRLPPSVRAELGRETLSGSLPAKFVGTREVTAVLHSSLPESDEVIAQAELQGAALRFHAEVPYRFGRGEPPPPILKRSAEPVRVRGVELGRPILIK